MSTKFCCVCDPGPPVAMMVIGYDAPEPAAGVPAIVAVPLALFGVNVSPGGNVPSMVSVVVLGLPGVVVITNEGLLALIWKVAVLAP